MVTMELGGSHGERGQQSEEELTREGKGAA
jgi:hypothetical protein